MIENRQVSHGALAVLAAFAITLNFFFVPNDYHQPWHQEKLEAAQLMEKAIGFVRGEALKRGLELDRLDDPNRTGLIGPESSPIVVEQGSLDTKIASTNPNLAAVFIDMFKHAGLKEGDRVAMAFTGSLPGANLAVLSAAAALKLKPLIITITTSSSWGASDPRFTWLDMEKALYDQGMISARTVAISPSRTDFVSQYLRPESVEIVRDVFRRNQPLLLIQSNNLESSVQKRMEAYDKAAAGEPIKAFLNIGSPRIVMGSQQNDIFLRQGLNRAETLPPLRGLGVLTEMAAKKIPIIHIRDIRQVIRDYELPIYPVPPPPVGDGLIFHVNKYSLAQAAWLTLILISGIALVIGIDRYVIPLLRERFFPSRDHYNAALSQENQKA